MLADSTRQLEIAKNLIVNGANINSNPEVVIMGTVGKPVLLQFLADHGFNLNARSSNGQTLTHYAVIMGYDLSLRTLVKNRANLNVKDGGNLTPLVWAINKWGSGGTPQEQKAGETAAKTLIQAGARINEKISTHETTVIFEAARFNRPDIVRYLIAAGGDPSISNKHNISVTEIQEQARAAGQVKEDARQRKLAEARSDPGLLMGAIALAGATAQNYAAIKQGALPQPSLGAMVNDAGRARAAPAPAAAAATTTTATTAQAPAPRRAAAADEAWKTCGPNVGCEVADGYNRFCAGPPKPGAPMCKSECRMSSGVAYHDTRLDSTRVYIGSSEACVPGCTGINSCG